MFAFLTKIGWLFKRLTSVNSNSGEVQPPKSGDLRDNLATEQPTAQPVEAEYQVAFLAEQAFLLEMAWKLTMCCQEDYYSEFYWTKQREALNWHIETRWEEYQQHKQTKLLDKN